MSCVVTGVIRRTVKSEITNHLSLHVASLLPRSFHPVIMVFFLTMHFYIMLSSFLQAFCLLSEQPLDLQIAKLRLRLCHRTHVLTEKISRQMF